MNKIERLDATTLLVQAGVENSAVAQFCLEHQLEGAAWMNRLPGQIGATVRMNARCYDGEISSLVKKVHALTPEGRPVVYEAAAIFLGYKNTIFQHNQHIIAAAEIALVPGEVMKIQRFMSDYASDREAKHQFDYPSCGCVFKNNYQASVPAGKLLDQAGVKNLAGRQTFISPHHANFVFNRGEATSREILELTLAMREAVYREFGVWLEYEMQIIGKVPSDLRQRLDEVRPQRFNEEKLAPLRKAFAAQQKKSEES
jgi:UDP-N-acetylmuramate dehydrogenase